MKKDDRVFLLHIWDAILQIEQYVDHVGATKFLQTRLLQDGVVRQLEIIEEASRNLTDTIRLQYPDVPWQQIIGLRNRIAHAYFLVNYELVWEIVQNNLPNLKAQIGEILNGFAEGDVNDGGGSGAG
ncbi:MAG: DUF86 domain-containing protein [Anaerolineales bacterium]|nr:DUF86 domain-containing protein [Anaerolineales bacterium]